MNKYQEALGNLVYKATKDNDGIIDQEWMDEVEEDSKKIQELVDRATPFKPMPTKDPWPKIIDIDFGKCACGQSVNTTLRFCDQCGQALDWRDYYKR